MNYKFFKHKLSILIVFSVFISNLSIAAVSNNTERFWASGEYLYWWIQDSPISVPLITKNNNPSALGLINEPGTQIIFGEGSNRNAFNLNATSGARMTIGGWIDESCRYGIEGSGFGLSQAENSFSASSLNSNIPVINVPFISAQTGSEDVLVFKRPNTVSVSDTFRPWGLELNGLYNLQDKIHFPLVFLFGFRYINFTEDLVLNDASYNIPTIPNAVLNIKDNFSTRNNFYGFQIGDRTHYNYRKFIFDLSTSIALGENYQKLIISGESNLNNTTILQRIGLFAEPTNIGSFTNHEFSVIPELKAKIGYEFNRYIRPFISYNCLYVNNVIRPGQQIDRNINLSQNPLFEGSGTLVGPRAPLPKFNNTGIWIQGISGGIEISF